MWKISAAVFVSGLRLIQCFSNTKLFPCHDDPTAAPEVGVLDEVLFNWLGVLQYIHIKRGTPHFFRVPRVVLVTPQYVLCTAKDASHVPDGHALGNVAFGEYERNDQECGLSEDRLREGAQCPITGLMVPLSDVVVHPEYREVLSPFSIALLKLLVPIKSKYMVPVCLPYKNYVQTRRQSSQIQYKLVHVDYITPVPRDFMEEDKEVLRISPLSKDICYSYDRKNVSKLLKRKIMCTSGCDFHSGAPSLVHEHTGHWSLVSIAQGGASCPDPLRESIRQPAPSRHTLIYPYVSWLTSVIMDEAATGTYSDDEDNPFGYFMPPTRRTTAWHGRWWLGGYRCYDRGPSSDNMYCFYHETFQIHSVPEEGSITYMFEILTKPSLLIDCVKIGRIRSLTTPEIWGLETNQVKIRMAMGVNRTFRFDVYAWAHSRPIDISYEDKPSGSGYGEDSEESDSESTEDMSTTIPNEDLTSESTTVAP